MSKIIDNIKNRCCACVVRSFLCALVLFIFVFLLLILLSPGFRKIYSNVYTFAEYDIANINGAEHYCIDYLLTKHKIIPIADVYQNTLSYYDTLVTFLVSILGLFAFISFFSLKSKIRNEVDESVSNYLDSNLFKDNLKTKLVEITQDILPDILEDAIKPRMDDMHSIITEEINKLLEKKEEELSDKIRSDIMAPLNSFDGKDK